MSDQVDALVYAMRALAPRAYCKGCGVELDTYTAEADGLCRSNIGPPFDTSRMCYVSFSSFVFRAGRAQQIRLRRYRNSPDLFAFELFGIDWTPEALVLFDEWLEQRTPLTPHVTPAE